MRAAVVRYVTSDAARSQRWIAPLSLYAALCALAYSDAGPLLTTYADTIAFLFLASIWLTWVVVNSEDPVQASITAVAVGGTARLRRAKVLSAYLCGAVLAVVATAAPLALGNHTDPVTASHVAAGVVGHLLAVGAGVAIGSLLIPSGLTAGWAFLVAVGGGLVEIAVPHVPPVRQLLVLFNEDHPAHLARALAITTAEAVVLSGVLIALALYVAGRE